MSEITVAADDPPLCGPLVALQARGTQDYYMEKFGPSFYDSRRTFLKDGPHQGVYKRIDTVQSVRTIRWQHHNDADRPVVEDAFIRVEKTTGDLVHEIDLAIPNASNRPLDELIDRIETQIGGQRIDVLYSPDIETQINTTCALLYGRRAVRHINGVTFVPLAMAPFHETNLMRPSTKHHDLYVIIRMGAVIGHDHPTYALYGNVYFLDKPARLRLLDAPHEFATIQNQSNHGDVSREEGGVTTVDLTYNHPLHLIYFWGFDKSKVRNVKLLLDNAAFYDGPIEALEHYKASRCAAPPHPDPTVIYFSRGRSFDEPCMGTINFSRIDRAKLVIESDQEDAFPVHVVGLNVQPMRYCHDMYGLVFSK